MRDLSAASSALERSTWTFLSPALSIRCLSGNLALGIVPPLAYSDHLSLGCLSCSPAASYLSSGTVPIRVVVHLALITSVSRDTATLALVIVTRCVCTLLCPNPLGFAGVVHLDLSAGTCPFPASTETVEVSPLPLENEPLVDT
jgi:hypothetical protein